MRSGTETEHTSIAGRLALQPYIEIHTPVAAGRCVRLEATDQFDHWMGPVELSSLCQEVQPQQCR